MENECRPPKILPRKLTWQWKKTTMNEDASPTKNGDFPASHVSFQGCISKDLTEKKARDTSIGSGSLKTLQKNSRDHENSWSWTEPPTKTVAIRCSHYELQGLGRAPNLQIAGEFPSKKLPFGGPRSREVAIHSCHVVTRSIWGSSWIKIRWSFFMTHDSMISEEIPSRERSRNTHLLKMKIIDFKKVPAGNTKYVTCSSFFGGPFPEGNVHKL